MQQVHVFIATTAGPVRVQYACGSPHPDEGPPIDHHTGVDGVGAADFNQEYDRFARLVISRWFGRRWFNASIETDIQQGESWKLALLSAHAVEADGARKLTDAKVREGDWVVLATGNVTQDSQIRGVDCIDRKFECAREHLDAWLDAGSRVVAVVPEDNDGDVPDEFRTYRRNGNPLTVVATAGVQDLLSQLSHLELLTGPVAATDTRRKADVSAEAHAAPHAGSSRRLWWMGAAVLALAAILALAREESMPDMVRDAIEMSRDIAGRGVEEIARVAKSGVTASSPESRKVDGEEDRVELTTEAPAAAVEEPQVGKETSGAVAGSAAALTRDSASAEVAVAHMSEGDSGGASFSDTDSAMGGATATTGSNLVKPPLSMSVADSHMGCFHESLQSVQPVSSQRIIIQPVEKVDPNFLVLRFIEESTHGSNHAHLRKVVRTTVKEVLNNSGYRTETGDSSETSPRSEWDREQTASTRSTMTGALSFFHLQSSRRTYPFVGDRIHVELEARVVHPGNSSGKPPRPLTVRKMEILPSVCGEQCETQAFLRVGTGAAITLAEQLVEMLATQRPHAAFFSYKLTLDNLAREERAGIEHALPRLPGYYDGRSEYGGNRRAEWKYMSHLNATYLCQELNEIAKFEGLDSVEIMIRP